MGKGKSLRLMKHTGQFKKHKGASLTASIKVIKNILNEQNERLFPKSISEQQELEKYYNKDITNIIDELDRWANCKQFVIMLYYWQWIDRKGLDLEKIQDSTKIKVSEKRALLLVAIISTKNLHQISL